MGFAAPALPVRTECPPGACICGRGALLADPGADARVLRLTREEEKRLLQRLEATASLAELRQLQERLHAQLGVRLTLQPALAEVRSLRGIATVVHAQPGLCRKTLQSLAAAVRQGLERHPQIVHALLDEGGLFADPGERPQRHPPGCLHGNNRPHAQPPEGQRAMTTQDDLFGDGAGASGASLPSRTAPGARGAAAGVQPAIFPPELHALAARLPPTLRLGGSTWSYPGWDGLVWGGTYSEQQLSRHGLTAYAQHPLLRTVGIDRGFYRPLSASDFARYAAQVPEDFRFVVKAPSMVTDALVRSEGGRGREANPAFLNATLATHHFVAPALEGMASRTGALVFQLSPLPWSLIDRLPEVLERLRTLLAAQPPLAPAAPDGVLAVEVRDAAWLAPGHLEHFADVLKSTGATYCLGMHARMPPLAEQLPLLRLLWPGPLVCRWNLNPVHGPRGYSEAEHAYAPFDRIHDPAPEQHALLARTLAGVCGRGHNAFVTISNHAEGCAPLSARHLAREVADRLLSDPPVVRQGL